MLAGSTGVFAGPGRRAEEIDCDPRQDLNSHVEDIARGAGLSRQTVYAHFPSRELLLDAVAGA
ncbi:MAG TPA: helix-turn-helix domain-containing protein [Streptosporangiaceae bacterium]